MPVLKLASCMAENSEPFCQNVTAYIQARLGIETGYVNDIPWQERERLFDEGEIQILWLCGLPYVYKADQPESDMELLAVPVPAGSRYQGRAIYFSDVIVKKESPFQTFAELRGAAWAYNEPRSHSGYNIVRASLFELGESQGFFGKVVESGTHQISLELILSSQVDGAAIDSTVLEWATARRSEIAQQIRIIATFGPSPIPPWVITKRVPESTRSQLRRLFLQMSEDPQGRSILDQGNITCFVLSSDSDYDAIRRMARAAEQVALQRSQLD
jgi:phosphonate transport system substrate-binding protein